MLHNVIAPQMCTDLALALSLMVRVDSAMMFNTKFTTMRAGARVFWPDFIQTHLNLSKWCCRVSQSWLERSVVKAVQTLHSMIPT